METNELLRTISHTDVPAAARLDALKGLKAKIDETFGSVGAYLEEGLGVTPELREELRDRYLE